MSPRQLALIALAFGALLLLWGAAALVRGGSSSAATERVLPALTREAVDTVVIARGGDTTVLARRDSAEWRVNGFAADRPAVISLLDALADSTRRGETVAERSASHAGFGVDSTGTLVRITGGGEVLAELVAGNRSPDFDGGYLRRADDSTVYLWRGPLLELLERSTDEWRDRAMAAVPADSVAAIEVRRGGRSYRLARQDGAWRFAAPRAGPADTAAIRALLDAYRRIEAAGFATPTQADSARFTPADRAVSLFRTDGRPLAAIAMDSTDGVFWARVDTGAVVYRLESWTADRLAPDESTLRPARPSP